MSGAIATDRVVKALEALYLGNENRDRKEAHEFLLKFQGTAAAWEVSVALLGKQSMQERYFGANTLYQKVKAQWADLNQEMRERLGKIINENLARMSKSEISIVTERLACAFVYISMHTSKDPMPLMQHVLKPKAHNPSYVLSVLAVVPAQLQSLNLAYTTTSKIYKSVKSVALHVLRYISQFLKTSNISPKLVRLAISSLASWLHAGVSLPMLVRMELLNVLFKLTPSMPEPILDLLGESVEELQNPSSQASVQSVVQVAGFLAKLEPMYDHALREGNMDICRIITVALARVGENAMDILARGPPAAISLFKMILKCTNNPDLRISELTQDVWLTLQYVEMKKRHSSLRAPIYKELLNVLLNRLQYPPPSSRLDPGDYNNYRDKCIEVIISCYGVLEADFLARIHDLIEYASKQSEIALRWRPVEVAAFVLAVVRDQLEASMLEADSHGKAALIRSIRELVARILKLTISMPSELQLRFRSLHCIHNLARFLIGDQHLRDNAVKFTVSATDPRAEGKVFYLEEDRKRVSMPTFAGEAFASICRHGCSYLQDAKIITQLATYVQTENPSLLLLDDKDAKTHPLADMGKCQRNFVKAFVFLALRIPNGADAKSITMKLLLPHARRLEHLSGLLSSLAKGEDQSQLHRIAEIRRRLAHRLLVLKEVIVVADSLSAADAVVAIAQQFWKGLEPVLSIPWGSKASSTLNRRQSHTMTGDDPLYLPGAVTQVLLELLSGLGGKAESFLGVLVNGSAVKFTSEGHHECLKVIHAAVRRFASERGTHQLFVEAFVVVANKIFQLFQTVPPDQLYKQDDVLVPFMQLAYLILTKCPVVLLTSRPPLAPPLLKIIPVLINHVRDYKLVTESLRLFRLMVKAGVAKELPEGVRKQVQDELGAMGPQMTQLLLITASTRIHPPGEIGASLHTLLKEVPLNFASQWIVNTLKNKHFDNLLRNEEKKKILDNALGLLRSNSNGRRNTVGLFKSLIADFSHMCECGGTHVDRMLTYQLAIRDREGKKR